MSAERPVDDARLATSILTRSLRLRRGESVIIETWADNAGMAEEFVVRARRLGIRPMVLYEGERSFFESQHLAPAQDASAIAAPELAALAAADGYVFLPGPSEHPRWAELSAPRKAVLDRWVDAWNGIARDQSVRCCYGFFAAARETAAGPYRVDIAEWRREVREASVVDPRVFRRSARRMVTRLTAGHRVTVTHPNGTRIDLGLAGRAPFVDDGCVDNDDLRAGQNWTVVPGGLVSVALHERTAEGQFLASRPSRHRRGTNPGIRWTFRGGRLVTYESDDPSGVFAASFAAGGKIRDRPATLSIGLNPRLHDSPLLEDQSRGMVCLWIGANEHYGGRSRGEFHDYALLEGADVTVDGRAIVRSGAIV